MDGESVLSKTPKGVEEIEQRKYKLDAKLRSILIMVNGKLSAGELAQKLGQFGDVPAMLEQLLEAGFVSAAGGGGGSGGSAEQLGRARTELARAISAALGPDGDSIAMKIEAAKTLEELRAYLESRRAVLDQVMGKAKSPAFWAKAAELLG